MGRRVWVVVVFAVLAFMVAACAENTVENPWGRLSIDWTPAGFLSLEIRLSENVPQPQEGATATWVITGHAHRFADDLYAWQIHFSEEFGNVMIIPNDFLATSAFMLVDVGVIADTENTGIALDVEIPEVAFLRPLVMTGDVLDIHAIWVQLEPLFTVTIPDKDSVAGSDDEPIGAGAAVGATEQRMPGEMEVGHDWLPPQTVYAHGEAIEHYFILLDPDTGEPAEWAVATINMLHILGQDPAEIVVFETIPEDPGTGIFSYRIETSPLSPGIYELIIWTSVETPSRRLRIEIVAP